MPDASVLMVLESTFPTRGGGGAEGQVRTISRFLQTKGISPTIIVPLTPDGPQQVHDEIDGVPVWRIRYPRVRIVGGLIMLCKLAGFLIANRRRYDAIHAHIAHNMAAVCCVIGRLLRKPVVVKLTGWLELKHGILANGGSKPTIMLRRWALRSTDRVQATSRELRDRLIAKRFRKDCIHVIPNAVDVDRYAVSLTERNARGLYDPLTAIFAGRLVPEKGLESFIRAWAGAFRQNDPARLIIIGDGLLRTELTRLARKLRRENQVRFLGAKDDVHRFLGKADIGVLPSRYEGLSNTLLEFMASGLPVLGTPVSGTADFVKDNDTGWLVRPDDIEGFTEALKGIQAMERSEIRAMGANARDYVERLAGIEFVSRRLIELYELAPCIATADERELV